MEYFYLGDQPLAMIRPGEALYYYHNDHLGTPQILTNDTGAVSWKAIYGPFGEAEISVATVENPLRFPGQYYDQETGLHYNWNRYYDPKTGRYLTPDPIESREEVNLFVYARNCPIMKIDPSGLFTIEGDCQGKDKEIRAGAERVCATIDQTITCPKLAKCMKKRCDKDKGKITCECCKKPKDLGHNSWLDDLFSISTSISVCVNNDRLLSKIDNVVMHEWAHSCNWRHGGGCGVPGQDGEL